MEERQRKKKELGKNGRRIQLRLTGPDWVNWSPTTVGGHGGTGAGDDRDDAHIRSAEGPSAFGSLGCLNAFRKGDGAMG